MCLSIPSKVISIDENNFAIVDTILGKEWLNKEYFRLGASRLANNLLGELEQKTVSYY